MDKGITFFMAIKATVSFQELGEHGL